KKQECTSVYKTYSNRKRKASTTLCRRLVIL
ncbi:MAG: hypothetical protein ACI9Y7_001824, partial [Dokdonia sp.]